MEDIVIKAENIGKIAASLGAGRIKKEDSIDMQAGIVLNKKVGDYVQEGEILATLYTNIESKLEEAKEEFEKAIVITEERQARQKMIIEII